MSRIAIGLVLVAAIASCGVGPGSMSGSWRFEGGKLDGQPVAILTRTGMTLTIDGVNASGRGGCNLYGGTIISGAGSFRFIPGGGTAVACADPIMASEAAFLDSLARADAAIVSGVRLALTGPGVGLLFTRIEPVSTDDLRNRTWVLETFNLDGVDEPAAGNRATLELEGDRFSGTTGCRTVSGRFIVQGDMITATQMSAGGNCPRELERQDGAVVGALGDGFTVGLEGDRLQVDGRYGQSLSYRLDSGG